MSSPRRPATTSIDPKQVELIVRTADIAARQCDPPENYRGDRSAWQEDLSQDVKLKVLQALGRGTAIDNLVAYVWRAVKNACIDEARRSRETLIDHNVEAEDLALAEDENLLQQYPAIVDLIRAIRRIVANLGREDPKAAEYVRMRFEGYTQADIARAIASTRHLTIGAADQQVSRSIEMAWTKFDEALENDDLYLRFLASRARERQTDGLAELDSAVRWGRVIESGSLRRCELRVGPFARIAKHLSDPTSEVVRLVASDEQLSTFAAECPSFLPQGSTICDVRVECTHAISRGRFLRTPDLARRSVDLLFKEVQGECAWVRNDVVGGQGARASERLRGCSEELHAFLLDYVRFGEPALLRQHFLDALAEYFGSRPSALEREAWA